MDSPDASSTPDIVTLADISADIDVERTLAQKFANTLVGQSIASDFLNSEETLLISENEVRPPDECVPLSSPEVTFRKRTLSVASETAGELVNVIVGPEHFELRKMIGEGGFGKVVLVKNRLDDKLYAMKVMDYLGGGELFFHLRRRGLILEKDAQFYFGEMVLAIDFLHNVNIIHRDLKPENVLLASDGHICITDFGLAKEIGDTSKNDTRTLCGTSEYMAPEMISRSGYGRPADWWSLGALFFEMLSGQPPFRAKTPKELDKKILSDKIVAPSFLTATAVSLLKGLLDKDPSKRLGGSKSTRFQVGGVSMLKRHPFFDGLDWDLLGDRQISPPFDVTSGASDEALNFHEGFTGQCLSPSLVLDAISNDGGSVRSTSPVRDGAMDDPYSDFGYTEPSFKVPKTRVAEFESKAAERAVKALKKKQHLLKLEEKRLQRVAAEEVERQKQAQIRREEAEKNRLNKAKAEQDRLQKEELQRKIGLYKDQKALFDAQNQLVSGHSEFLTNMVKKVKNIRKKLSGITELEKKIEVEKISLRKLSTEQREKLDRKQGLEDDLAELLDSDCGAEEEFASQMSALLNNPKIAYVKASMAISEAPTNNNGPASPTPGALETIQEVMARLEFPIYLEPQEPIKQEAVLDLKTADGFGSAIDISAGDCSGVGPGMPATAWASTSVPVVVVSTASVAVGKSQNDINISSSSGGCGGGTPAGASTDEDWNTVSTPSKKQGKRKK